MSKIKRLQCVSCGIEKGLRNFYRSNSPLHSHGYIPYCKDCLKEQLGDQTVNEVKNVLRMIDRPFLQEVWEDALLEDDDTFGVYMRHLGLKHNNQLTWDDSRYEGMVIDETSDKYGGGKLTKARIKELEAEWGHAYNPEQLILFENKYQNLVSNYPVNTSLHEEALKTYCVYKVQAELSTARGDVDDAKKWGEMAQKQGEIAKINLNKLSQSDLSQGLDGFGQLARMVEQSVDIVPILPKFIEKPHDKIDFAILCYVNYMRNLEGLPEVSHSDLYQFYEDSLKEHIKLNPELDDIVVEVDIDDGFGGKKKLKTIDHSQRIKQLQEENPNNVFYQHLDKWIEVVSYFRWFPDLFFDMIRPEKGGMRLDADQRMLIRGLARFKQVMGVLSRGYGKCVAGDTIINTNNGFQEIGALFDYQRDNNETYYSFKDLYVLNKDHVSEQATRGVYSGYKPTNIITTHEGFEIETTLVHPLLVKTKQGLEWKKADSIQIGDYIPIQRQGYLFGNQESIYDIWERTLKAIQCKSKDMDLLYQLLYIPRTLNQSISYFLGYVIECKQTYYDKGMIIHTKHNNTTIHTEHVLDTMELEYVQQTKSSYNIKNKALKYWLNELNLDRTQAHSVAIPNIVLRSTRQNIQSFLQGLFDMNGVVHKDYIECILSSEKLAKQIQTLLLAFNIVSTRKKEYDTVNKCVTHHIIIENYNIYEYNVNIGFAIQSKQILLDDICMLYKDIWHEKYQSIKDCQYFYSPVVNIDTSNNHVYDLYVPNTHSFNGNGMINHNTMIQLMANYNTAIWYPDTTLVMTAQTKENASNLIGEKYTELSKFFPLINDELKCDPVIRDDKALVTFKSGAEIDTLPNSQGAKGARRHRITVEESAQVSSTIFQDVLEPVVNIPRRTIGERAIVNPYELNGQINRFTTSWYKGSNEYETSLRLKDDMINLKGVFSLGAGWELPCAFGRGELKSQILSKKDSILPTFFSLNYESKWVGVSGNALVDISDVVACRTLTTAELEGKPNDEYYIGVDVARSQDSANNQCSVAVVKVKRNTDNKINAMQLVNIINIPAVLNFKVQAQEVMRIRNKYNATAVVVDGNGLGAGLIDQLVLEQIDPNTMESLGCWKTINTDQESELSTAEEILYNLKAQQVNSEVIVNFVDVIESHKIQLLEKRADTSIEIQNEDYLHNKILPFFQTDMLEHEIANLKLKVLPSGKLTVEQQTRSVDKDRYSALAYVLWYINTFENDVNAVGDDEIEDFLLIN